MVKPLLDNMKEAQVELLGLSRTLSKNIPIRKCSYIESFYLNSIEQLQHFVGFLLGDQC